MSGRVRLLRCRVDISSMPGCLLSILAHATLSTEPLLLFPGRCMKAGTLERSALSCRCYTSIRLDTGTGRVRRHDPEGILVWPPCGSEGARAGQPSQSEGAHATARSAPSVTIGRLEPSCLEDAWAHGRTDVFPHPSGSPAHVPTRCRGYGPASAHEAAAQPKWRAAALPNT